ncbi:TH1 protein [Gracilaria domingensis]|nr:TH1 protein [Gracilaria domingensis]
MNDTLNAFERLDAILGENIEAELRTFASSGGDLNEACEALSQSYEGLPDMLRLLVEWIDSYGNGTEVLEKAFQTFITANEANIIPKLDDSLAKPGAKEFLASVVSSNRWNPVVSDMALRHKKSLLYDMLMREKRLKDADLNLTTVTSEPAFVKALQEQFSMFFNSSAGQTNVSLQNLFARVTALCSYDEHTLVVGTRFLSYMSRHASQQLTKGVYTRVGEEVRKAVIEKATTTTSVSEQEKKHELFRMFAMIDAAVAGAAISRNVVDALVNILVREGTKPSFENEIVTLAGIYGFLLGDIGASYMSDMITDGSSIVDTTFGLSVKDKAFYIELLCHMEIVEGIMNATFSHYHRSYARERVPDVGKRKCLVLLLTYVEIFRTMPEKDIRGVLDNSSLRESFRNSLMSGTERINIVIAACEACPPGTPWFKMKRGHAKTLVDAVSNPLMAYGVYMWACEGLKGSTDARALIKTAPKHLAFLQAVAETHVQLRPKILDVVHEAFVRDYDGLDITQIEDMRDMYVKYIISLTRIQMAPEVVEAFFEKWAGDERIDQAHLRRFVSGLLDTISLPFTKELEEKFARLVQHARLISPMPLHRTHELGAIAKRTACLMRDFGSPTKIDDERHSSVKPVMEASRHCEEIAVSAYLHHWPARRSNQDRVARALSGSESKEARSIMLSLGIRRIKSGLQQ